MTMTAKACSKCRIEQPLEAYSRYSRNRDGRRARCKACCAEDYKAYAQADREHYAALKRAGKYRYRFNLSVEQVEAMFAAVNYLCESCGDHRDSTGNGVLVLDHDHGCCPTERTCGKCIRGVLCTKCNVALGALNDNLTRVDALAAYMRRQ